MNDIVIPEGDYIEIVKPICINPFGYYFKFADFVSST